MIVTLVARLVQCSTVDHLHDHFHYKRNKNFRSVFCSGTLLCCEAASAGLLDQISRYTFLLLLVRGENADFDIARIRNLVVFLFL